MAFILSVIAGLATMLGIIPIYTNKKYKDKIINYTLNFASGVMLTISILDLIPESYNYLNNIYIVLFFFIIGFIIALFIDTITKNKSNKLYRVGVVSMLSLILHNIPEGIITYISCKSNIKLGIKMTIAITMHNIPEGISIAVPIYYGSRSRVKAIVYTFIAAITEPVAALLTSLFIGNLINNTLLGILLSITAGIMTYIPIFELLSNTKIKPIIFLIGSIFIYLTIAIL